MSTGTHTPGPWQLHKSDDTLVLGSDGREVAEACGDYTDEAEWPRMEANARLIAAAPDMLAALKNILNSIEVNDDKAVFDALAAIARAEGRA